MNKLTTIEQVTAYTKAGGGCLTCFDQLEEMLARTNAEIVAEGLLAERDAYRVGTAVPQEIKAKAQQTKAQQTKPDAAKTAVQTSPLAPVRRCRRQAPE